MSINHITLFNEIYYIFRNDDTMGVKELDELTNEEFDFMLFSALNDRKTIDKNGTVVYR